LPINDITFVSAVVAAFAVFAATLSGGAYETLRRD
jgi:hypothetical protein